MLCTMTATKIDIGSSVIYKISASSFIFLTIKEMRFNFSFRKMANFHSIVKVVLLQVRLFLRRYSNMPTLMAAYFIIDIVVKYEIFISHIKSIGPNTDDVTAVHSICYRF